MCYTNRHTHHIQENMIKTIVLATAITVFGCNLVQARPTPELGNPANIKFSRDKAAYIGRILVAQLQKRNMIINDNLAQSYLQSIAETVADPIRQNGKRTHIFIIRDSSTNAMSLPGGYIGINSGLILKTETESQLAAVIAHETAHVMQNHIARKVASGAKNRLPSLLGIAAAIGLGAAGNGSAAAGAMMSGMAGSAEAGINFTRKEEQEADDFGLYSLNHSNYDPNGMVEFLQIMQHQDLSYLDRDKLGIADHPDLSTRISEARNRIKNSPKHKHQSKSHYYLLKARILADTNQNNRLLPITTPQRRIVKTYLYALEMADKKKWCASLQQAQKLQQLRPNQWWFDLLAARTAAHCNKDLALYTYQLLLDLHPGNKAITLSAIESYIAMGYTRKAKHVINQVVMEHPNSSLAYQMLAKVQAKDNQPASASLSLAKAAFLAGNPRYAAALISLINKKQLKSFEKIRLKGLDIEIKRELALKSNLRQNKRPL